MFWRDLWDDRVWVVGGEFFENMLSGKVVWYFGLNFCKYCVIWLEVFNIEV